MKELNVIQMEEIEGGMRVMCGVGIAWTGARVGFLFGGIMGAAAGAIVGGIAGALIC